MLGPGPNVVRAGVVSTPTNGTKPQPGFPVYWNATADRWQVPTTNAQILLIGGVIPYTKGDVANASGIVEYEDDAVVDIVRQGSIYVKAGVAIAQMAQVTWDATDKDYILKPALVVPTDNTKANIDAAFGLRRLTGMENGESSDVSSGNIFLLRLVGPVLS